MGHRFNSFVDIPKNFHASTLSTCVIASSSLEDVNFNITSFDDSCIPNYPLSACIKNFDTSSDLYVDCDDFGMTKNNQGKHKDDKDITENDYEEVKRKKHCRYKSLLSMIKILKKFSVKETKNASCEPTTKSILRRPRQYTFVKGISGLNIRVERISSASTAKTFCHRCRVRNG